MDILQPDHAQDSPVDNEELRAVIAEVLEVDQDEITDDADFMGDLGIDSLMALEVVVVLEKRYGVKFVESELRDIVSLRQARDLLGAKLVGR